MTENMGGPEGTPQAPQQPSPMQQPDPMGLGPTSMGMAANVAAGCSYLLTWITGLIFFLSEKQNKFVRFNAAQAICLGILSAVLGFLYSFLVVGAAAAAATASSSAAAAGGMGLMGLVFMVIWLGFFVLWVVCLIKAFTGKWFKIPVIGDMAMKWAGVDRMG